MVGGAKGGGSATVADRGLKAGDSGERTSGADRFSARCERDSLMRGDRHGEDTMGKKCPLDNPTSRSGAAARELREHRERGQKQR